jgi:hypothetical protein
MSPPYIRLISCARQLKLWQSEMARRRDLIPRAY